MFTDRRPRRPGVPQPKAGWTDGLTPTRGVVAAVVAVTVWILAPGPHLTITVPASARGPAAVGLPWLHAARDGVHDDAGHTVLLRGFNTEALLETNSGRPPLQDSDLDLMQAEGFDSVRLPVVWSRIEPSRGRFDSAYVDLIARTIARINERGMYVVVDMHFLDWSAQFGGHGAPEWAHVRGVPDARLLPEPWGRHLSPAQLVDYTYFWTSPDWQRDFFQSWRFLAMRLQSNSGVAGYDIFNEPHPFLLPPGAFERQAMWPVYAQAINAIASVDPNHLFVVESTLFGDWGSATEPLQAPNVVYSGHVYTGSLIPPAFTGDSSALIAHIDGQQREAAQLDAPLWEGELGIDHGQAHASAWADAALDHMDDLAIGWSWWQWREDSRWGIVNGDGTVVDSAFLRHLARPYMISAPRTAHAGRGDATVGRLSIQLPGGINDVITVAWPDTLPGAPMVQTDCVSAVAGPVHDGRTQVTVTTAAPCTVTLSAVATSP